jgi:hypothetical protein
VTSYAGYDAIEPEIDLVVWSMQRFDKGSPERERITRIWHRCSLSRALREGFPPGTEDLQNEWQALAECRRSVQ